MRIANKIHLFILKLNKYFAIKKFNGNNNTIPTIKKTILLVVQRLILLLWIIIRVRWKDKEPRIPIPIINSIILPIITFLQLLYPNVFKNIIRISNIINHTKNKQNIKKLTLGTGNAATGNAANNKLFIDLYHLITLVQND